MTTVVLDAMGVIFEVADDVEELLVPFVRKHGGYTGNGAVQLAYLKASLGEIDPDVFWETVGLSTELEDLYLERHTMMPGACEFLGAATDAGIQVWCLSNDVGRWSEQLRSRFSLNQYLAGSVISSEVNVRKPDEAIYRSLLDRSGLAARDVIFFDDRESNVSAARRLGMKARLFRPTAGFDEVARLVLQRPLRTQ